MRFVDRLNDIWGRSPLGLKLIALGALLNGAGDVAASFVECRDDSVWVGVLIFAYGAVTVVTGVGLLYLERWAWWMAAAILMLIYIGPVLVGLFTKEVDDMAGPRVILYAIFAVVPLYLVRPRIRTLFGINSPRPKVAQNGVK